MNARHWTVIVTLAGVVASFSSAHADDLETTMFPRNWQCGYQQGWTFADLNNDGLRDMVAVSDGGELCARLGNGDGTFGPVTTTEMNACVGWPVVADFNLDGKVDVAASWFFWPDGALVSALFLLLGNGDGTFAPPVGMSFGCGIVFKAVGDFDENDAPDLLITDTCWGGGGGVWLLLGTGDGQFLPEQNLTLGEGSFSVTVSDFDADGHEDFATYVPGVGAEYVRVFLGVGNGTFHAVDQFEAPASWPMQLVSGDLDNDGDPDLVVSGGQDYDHVSVSLAHGDGTFQPAQQYAVPSNSHAVAIGDIDGDGTADLAVSHLYGLTSILHGTGGGGFGPAETFGVSHSSITDRIKILDLDEDGDNDIVRGSTNGSVFLSNRGDGTFPTYVTTAVNPEVSRMVAVHVDGDGVLDLLVASEPTEPGPIGVLLGVGDGTFELSDEAGATDTHSAFLVAELGQGPIEDLASVDRLSNTVRVYPGEGAGTFGPGSSWAVGSQPRSIAAGDLDGDDDLDLVTGNYGSNDVSVLLQDATGFAPEVRYASGQRPVSVALGFLDSDASLDLVVASGSPSGFTVYPGMGDGTFGSSTFYPVGELLPASVFVLDFDQDGELDVVVATYCRIWWFPGVGNGTLLEGIQLNSTCLYEPLLGDIDGDGRLDLLGGFGDVLLGNGDGTFQPSFSIVPYANTVGDFTGDGRADYAQFAIFADEIWVTPNECLGAEMRLTASADEFGWRGMCGTQNYNVYRHEFASALSDGNEDGLPDEGYGECVNDLDDDTTDTLLADPEIPLPGGNGFAYLVSWVDLDGERGLGSTSAGLPREDVLPCP